MTENDYNKTGLILSIIGGLSSIALGFFAPFFFPIVALVLGKYLLIIQAFLCSGGILTLTGTAIVSHDIKRGKLIIIISGFVAGINMLTLIGAKLLTEKRDQEKLLYNITFPYICTSCREFFHTFAEYCENCGTKGSLRATRKNDYEETKMGQKS